MRTKHLLTAMMLPVLFAACTNDDFESLNQNVPSVEGRTLVDNVTLNVSTGVDTRLVYDGEDYKWEPGDPIGACLMDELNKSNYKQIGTTWSGWFTLTDYIQTNYKFTRGETGEWTTEAKLCEGNYFFAYPYNANQGLRTAYEFSAAAQVLEDTDKAALMEAFTKNNSFVGYGKVTEGADEGEAVSVNMIPVFGSTGFTIENTGTQSYTIERIVLHGTKVSNKAVVNPTTCTLATQYSSNVTPTAVSGSDYYFNVAQYTKDLSEEKLYGGMYDAEWDGNDNPPYSATAALRDVLDPTAGNVEVIIKGGKTIASNQSINLIAMVYPAEVSAYNTSTPSTVTEVLLDIYTDKGVIQNIALNKRWTKQDGTTNVLTDKALSGLGNGEKVKITFDDTAFDTPNEMSVGSEADLANLIHWNAETAAPITANLTADVHITKAMYEELAGSVITKATLVKALTNSNPTCNVIIDADVADGALDAFTFGNGITGVTVKGTQSMTKKACEAPVIVDADATLNIAGDMKLAAKIDNYGTLNVNANVDATTNNTLVNNYSTMSVAADKTIAENVKVSNIGMPAYEIPGIITNAGTIVKLANDYGTVTNTGVIGKEAAIDSNNFAGYNEGVIYNNSGKVFLMSNSGNIYANGTSTTRVQDNVRSSVEGNLIITNLDADNGNFLTGTNKGNIVQEITKDANTDAVDTRANTLWLSAALKVEKTDKDGNYVEVNFASGANLKNGAITLVATGANARIDGNEQIIRFDAIEINKDATLTINKVTVAIAAATNVTMKGEKDHEATLSINSNARLGVTNSGAAIQIQGGATYNNLDNNSSSTKISFQ